MWGVAGKYGKWQENYDKIYLWIVFRNKRNKREKTLPPLAIINYSNSARQQAHEYKRYIL